MRALPAVESAGTIDSLPLTGGGSMQPIVVEGRPAGLFAEQPEVAVRRISAEYIGAMKVPQKYRIAAPAHDYLTDFEAWRAMQNGGLAPSTAFAEGTSHIVAAPSGEWSRPIKCPISCKATDSTK